ncbi:hypothetical protein BDQ17DRAFT_1329003 [Cyathus striatus]|nr:hypothetical protein BDQ17DRAFT_1329003 [Cyathus striatus]
MFEKAKSFVIQNDVKKTTRSEDVHQSESQHILNYTQFKMGDIHVVDGHVEVDSVSNDIVVEVMVGETKKRAARIYRGPQGNVQLQMELEFMSKLWPHPAIRQVFGIIKCHGTTGTHRRYEEYALSLKPLQRAAFTIKYIREYNDTRKYLISHISSRRLPIDYTVFPDGVTDQLRLFTEGDIYSGRDTIDFYAGSSGMLFTVLTDGILRNLRKTFLQANFK